MGAAEHGNFREQPKRAWPIARAGRGNSDFRGEASAKAIFSTRGARMRRNGRLFCADKTFMTEAPQKIDLGGQARLSLRPASAKQRLRVVLTLPNLGIGGAEVVNVSLAEQFVKAGLDVDIATGWDADEKSLPIPAGVRHFALGGKQTRDILFPFIRYLRSERPDAVIASLWPFTATCVLAHQWSGCAGRMAIWEHNTLSLQYRNRGLAHRGLLRASMAYECRRADVRVAVSRGVADDLSALSGVPRDRFSVIYNPLLSRESAPSDAEAAEAIWGGWRGARIITVGRFKAQKNHSLLLRAFQRLLARSDARLLILGTGDLREPTAALVRELGLADKVIMPGAVPDPDPYYRSANLFALSSDYEGFGNVVVEALACGLPVVSTDCKSGPAEILENGRYGRLVPVGDADALARAMVEALAAEHDREALKRRALDFAPERIADQYLQLLFPEHSGARQR